MNQYPSNINNWLAAHVVFPFMNIGKIPGASFNTNAAAAAACLFACHPALRISLIISSWGGTTAKFAGPSLPTRVCNTMRLCWKAQPASHPTPLEVVGRPLRWGILMSQQRATLCTLTSDFLIASKQNLWHHPKRSSSSAWLWMVQHWEKMPWLSTPCQRYPNRLQFLAPKFPGKITLSSSEAKIRTRQYGSTSPKWAWLHARLLQKDSTSVDQSLSNSISCAKAKSSLSNTWFSEGFVSFRRHTMSAQACPWFFCKLFGTMFHLPFQRTTEALSCSHLPGIQGGHGTLCAILCRHRQSFAPWFGYLFAWRAQLQMHKWFWIDSSMHWTLASFTCQCHLGFKHYNKTTSPT